MEGSVFYVSSWHTWNCERSELVLTFSQTFCLKTNACSHSLQPLPNGQILLTSLFPEECNCILFPPRSCRVPAACQCKQFPSLPGRRAPEAREQRRLDGLQEARPCRAAGAHTRSCKRWKPGYWVLRVRELGWCFPSPGASVLGEPGGAWIGISWGFLCQALCASKQRPACGACSLFPLSSCPSFRGPVLERASLLCLIACARGSLSSITQVSGGICSGEPLAWSGWQLSLAGDSPVPWDFICRAVLSARGCSTSPTPALPHPLLQSALLVKLLPAFLPRNNLFCHPDSWGLKGKTSVFRESIFVFPVTSLFNKQGSQLWHNSADSLPRCWE